MNPGRVIPANCEELFERGQTKTGNYLIQPSTEVSPFEVLCNFEENPVMTVIKHDKEALQSTVKPGGSGCEPKG